MSTARVIIVHLRRPNRADPHESRSDPFYELGSFGCTGCHRRNLMNPRRADELEGQRLAFAQGGDEGFKLVHLTPPIRVVRHADRCELVWKPAVRPFRYDRAPLVVNRAGESNFPKLLGLLQRVDRPTWPARFSSAFRTRRTPLPALVGAEAVRVFDRLRKRAGAAGLARSYVDTLPYPPNVQDRQRKRTLMDWRAEAGAVVTPGALMAVRVAVRWPSGEPCGRVRGVGKRGRRSCVTGRGSC